jgi:hypothetical protein
MCLPEAKEWQRHAEPEPLLSDLDFKPLRTNQDAKSPVEGPEQGTLLGANDTPSATDAPLQEMSGQFAARPLPIDRLRLRSESETSCGLTL